MDLNEFKDTVLRFLALNQIDEAESLLDKYEKLVKAINREQLVEETSEAWLDKAEFDILRNSDVLRNASGLLAVNSIENDEIKEEEDVWENYVPDKLKEYKNTRDYLKGNSKISPDNYDAIKKNELFYNLNRDEYYEMKDKYLEIINNNKLSKSAKDKMLESLEMAFDGILVRSISWKDTYSRMMYGEAYKYGLLTHLGHFKESIDNILEKFNDENYDKFKRLSKLFHLVYKDFFENEEDVYIEDTTGNLDKGVVNKYDIEDLYIIMKNKLSSVSKDFTSFIKEMFDKHYLDLREIKNDDNTYRFYFDNVNEYRIRCGYKGDLGDVVSIFAKVGISFMCQKSYGSGERLVKCIPDPMYGILNRFFSLILIDGIKENGKYVQDLPYIMIHNGFKDIANLLDYLVCFELECEVAENYKYYNFNFDDINEIYFKELLKAYDEKYIKIYKSNQSGWLDKRCFYDDNKMGSMIINILISFLLYKKYKENQEEFSKNFDEMVKDVRVNSFNETIEKFGIDLRDKSMIDEALDAMNDFIEEFELTIK